jgi:hypothetical protein
MLNQWKNKMKNLSQKDKKDFSDTEITDINRKIWDLIFCEGGDDEIGEYDSNRFAYHMTIRLTKDDIIHKGSNLKDEDFPYLDSDDDFLKLYCKLKYEVLDLIKQGKLNLNQDDSERRIEKFKDIDFEIIESALEEIWNQKGYESLNSIDEVWETIIEETGSSELLAIIQKLRS